MKDTNKRNEDVNVIIENENIINVKGMQRDRWKE